jgi:hypothetical protein
MKENTYKLKGKEWLPFVINPYYKRVNKQLELDSGTNRDYNRIGDNIAFAGIYQTITTQLTLMAIALGTIAGLETLLK